MAPAKFIRKLNGSGQIHKEIKWFRLNSVEKLFGLACRYQLRHIMKVFHLRSWFHRTSCRDLYDGNLILQSVPLSCITDPCAPGKDIQITKWPLRILKGKKKPGYGWRSLMPNVGSDIQVGLNGTWCGINGEFVGMVNVAMPSMEREEKTVWMKKVKGIFSFKLLICCIFLQDQF